MKKFRWKLAQFFEKYWWQNYLSSKNSSTYLNWKRNYWKSVLTKTNIKLKGNVIDIGCGPAGIFTIANNQYIDALDPLIDTYIKKRLLTPKRYPNVHFISTSLESFSSIKRYDTLCCLNAINHCENISACVQNLAILANTNSTLLLSTDVHKYKIFKFLFSLFPLDILHPQQMTLQDYEKLLIKNGFNIIDKIEETSSFIYSYWFIKAKKIHETIR